MRLDLIQFLKEAFPQAQELPTLSSLYEYVLLSTDETDFITSNEQDIEKVVFIAEKDNGDIVFHDPQKQVIIRNIKDWKKTWVVFETRLSFLGSLLYREYEDLVKAIKETLPTHLKDRVKF